MSGSGRPSAEVLAEIRGALAEARSMPMSSSAVVNRAQLLALLDELEEARAGEDTEASRVLAARDHIVADARQEAEQIRHEARLEQGRLVSDTEVYRLAQRRAEEAAAAARSEAEELRREADEYVDGRLAGLEITLERTLETVKRGRERLAGRSELDALGEDDDEDELPRHLRDSSD